MDILTRNARKLLRNPRETVRDFAQRSANEYHEAYGVYEHVGVYGRPGGDIPARHVFRAFRFNGGEPGPEWALVECVDPEGV